MKSISVVSAIANNRKKNIIKEETQCQYFQCFMA